MGKYLRYTLKLYINTFISKLMDKHSQSYAQTTKNFFNPKYFTIGNKQVLSSFRITFDSSSQEAYKKLNDE